MAVERGYSRALSAALRRPLAVAAVFLVLLGTAALLYREIPSEYAPKEDRGAFFLLVNGPEGASFDYMTEYMDEIERRLTPLVERGEVTRLLIRAPRAFGNIETFNTGIGILVLSDWAERRSGWVIMDEVRRLTSDLPGVRAFPVMRQGFGGGIQKPVQFVIGGGTYAELAEWRDILLARLAENNPGLVGVDHDYKETNPQLRVEIDRNRAGDLGVTLGNIGRTLETMLGSRQVTTYIDAGEEYDVILEGERDAQRTPTDIENVYVRSERTGQLIPLSNLVTMEAFADSATLNRYNRVRAITIEANLAPGYTLGEALAHLEALAEEHLPDSVLIDYKGESLDLKSSSGSLLFVFLLGIAVVFLVLAAQFESYLHPLVIMLTVPLAITGALLGLYMTGGSLNIYSQIGLIMLVGLAAKNGILIVEFVNQRRDQGLAFDRAVIEASVARLRPIVMTGITTAAGSVPLIMAFGAGAETRTVIGTVVFSGVLAATLFTLFVVPVAYSAFGRRTGSPGDVAQRLAAEMQEQGTKPPSPVTRLFADRPAAE